MWPQWTSMLSPWQWAVLGLVPPAIIALYFLKLRRTPLDVPSTYLWHRAVEDLRVNSLWQRLRNSLLLLLQLAIIALLMLALGRPAWQTEQTVSERAVLMIDHSASMSADDVAPSRLAAAKRMALQRIDGMRPNDVAMVISFSDRARVEQPYTSNRAALRDAVRRIQPTQRGTDLEEAVKLAAGLANPAKTGDLTDIQVAEARPADALIFSDGGFAEVEDFALGNIRPEFIPVGRPTTGNVGIVAFSGGGADTGSDRTQLFGRLLNAGTEPQEVVVELLRDGALIDAEQLPLRGGESRGVVFELDRVESGEFELRATVDDALRLDNRAWLAVEPPQRIRVLCVTPGNRPLERALATEKSARLADVTVVGAEYIESEEYARQAERGAYDLVIYDRCRPDLAPQAHTFYIGGVPPEDDWKLAAVAPAPQVLDTQRGHPLMQWIELGDVLFAEATPLEPPDSATVLIETDAGPLMAIAPREGFEDLVLGVELYNAERPVTNWSVRPSFPVLVLNLLQYFSRQSLVTGPAIQSVRPGEEVVLTATAGRVATVILPDGQEEKLPPSDAAELFFNRTDQLGIYEVRIEGRPSRQFAVNLFNPRESDVQVDPETKINIGNVEVTASDSGRRVRRDIWKWLLLAALVVLIVEWMLYLHRAAPRASTHHWQPVGSS